MAEAVAVMEAARTEPFKVTPELLTEVRSDPKKIHQYKGKEREAILKAAVEGDAGQAEPEQVKEPEKEAKAPEAEKQPEGEADDEAQARRKAKRDTKYWEDRQNKVKQQIDADEKRLKDLRDKLEAAKTVSVEKPEDPLSDEYQTGLAKQLAEAMKRLETLETRYQDDVESQVKSGKEELQTTTEKAVFKSLEDLQDRFPSLKTKDSIVTLNKKYANFLNDVVSASGLQKEGADVNEVRAAAMERYNSDPEFQKLVKSKPPEEMDKLSLLLKAQNRAQAMGGSVKSHLLDIMDETGILAAQFERGTRSAAEDAATRTLRAMDSANEIKTIGPGDGAARSGTTALDDARETLRRLNKKSADRQPWTQDEKIAHRQSLQLLAQG